MSALSEIFSFITGGSIAGVSPLIIIAITFVIGVIIGYLTRKILKIAIIAAVILIIISYLGLFGLSLSALKTAAETYGPMIIQLSVLLVGVLPIGLGFIVGLIVGLIFS
ncbi:MAG: hypothetical protein LBH62_06880 [Nitrososphaerota archaeon]|jgi:uncharacterized membrane protein (Fun14 family)|uniref:hypothetical protein n=1 Tax=Candidatus Bathycorpusculum sp. TaxID=2994959 RepID=UPI002832093F|nr:hypothetical protein [Candidatus Termiticorpusculum sp.]MDR0461136.1 hypothetical protein [Nitrososphaerota archaeon]